ncbi:MAG: hypothetical protein EBE86_033865 [Hormoscilla sp. GUM202]|nr:hypothetical protein [Hormoscilla sp. GUM202]
MLKTAGANVAAKQNFLFEFKDLCHHMPVSYGQSRAIERDCFSQKEVTRPIIT